MSARRPSGSPANSSGPNSPDDHSLPAAIADSGRAPVGDSGRSPDSDSGRSPVGAQAGRLFQAASLIAFGTVASKVLGIVRNQLIASYWSRSVQADAFNAASRVPTMIFDLLIGGMLTAALVPVLAGYRRSDEAEFWRASSALTAAAALVSGLAACLVYVWAPQVAAALGGHKLGEVGFGIVIQSLRYMAPAVFFFGLVGLCQAVLYARERVTLPALAMPAYNLALIATMLVATPWLGVYALALGVSVGALAQLLILGPGLRDANWHPSLRHPAIGRVLALYLPIGAGLLFTQVQVTLDTNFAASAGGALSTLTYATNLYQFPHGFIAVAISLAILPTLAASHAAAEPDEYARTLSRGLRTVMALTLPATVGLAVLAEPVAGVIFQHGSFLATDRIAVELALFAYLIGLPFAAIDWPLNYAFYARQTTWIPALIGVFSIGVYLVVAVMIGPTRNLLALAPGRLFLGLALAESAKQIAHALVMLYLVQRAAGKAAVRGLASSTLRATLAALAMGMVLWGLDHALAGAWGGGTWAWAARAGVGLGVGAAVYLPLASRLGVDEIGWLVNLLRARLGSSDAPSPMAT